MPSPSSDKAALPLRWQGTPDGRSRGRPVQFVRDYLAGHPEGATREELEQAIQAHRSSLCTHAPRSFTKLIYPLKKKGEVAEVDGKLVARRLTRTSRGRHG